MSPSVPGPALALAPAFADYPAGFPKALNLMLSSRPQNRRARVWWGLALLGQFVFVFAAVALSGPGRIDIDDGQARFEVAQSLVDHRDPVVRDPDIWYTILPGRDGQRYSNYRLPHSAGGAVAVLMADAGGPVSEARRHFFFVLTSAFACAGLAVTYSVLFRSLGHGRAAALCWASAGIFCTPNWYYGTSTFDDIFGAAAVVLAVAVAWMSRHKRPLLGAAAAGLVIGLAFNFKQPLAVFVLAVLAAHYDRNLNLRAQLARVGLVLVGLGAGVAFYQGYELYKFPPGTTAGHAAILKQWEPIWMDSPLPGLLDLTLSPGAGAVWYCPTALLSLAGLAWWYRSEKPLCLAVLAGTVVFVGFISMLTFFKGDLSWGPRYLTPIFALLWVFVPTGAAAFRPRMVTLVLLAGFTVQVLGLSVDPHRLYLKRNLWSRFYVVDPWLYFHPAISHLANRPREIVEILSDDTPAEAFTPARSPTYCFPIPERIPGGPEAVHHYRVLNSLRPWWISQRYLRAEERPVDLGATFGLLAGAVLGGLALMLLGCQNRRGADDPTGSRQVLAPASAGCDPACTPVT